MLRHDGTLDRQKLGEIVFHDEPARARLNAIVHPAVRELSARLLEQVEAEDPDAVVVYDVPLLVEAAVDHPFDLIVVTSAPKRTQVERLVEERGLDPTRRRRASTPRSTTPSGSPSPMSSSTPTARWPTP